MPFSVVLPAGFAAGPRLPAVVLLHGDGRNHHTLLDDAGTKAALLQSQSVVVLPDAQGGWWLNDGSLLRLLDELTAELHLDASRIACAGWSMGGHGSLRLIERHPERFAAWAGIIALADYPNAAYPPESNYRVPALFGDAAHWPEANPMRDVERLRGKALWFATGDAGFDAAMNRTLDRRLEALGIPHEFREVAGRHDFPTLSVLLPQALAFLDKVLMRSK
jgi:S-formylglutathione hydrolase FrmB